MAARMDREMKITAVRSHQFQGLGISIASTAPWGQPQSQGASEGWKSLDENLRSLHVLAEIICACTGVWGLPTAATGQTSSTGEEIAVPWPFSKVPAGHSEMAVQPVAAGAGWGSFNADPPLSEVWSSGPTFLISPSPGPMPTHGPRPGPPRFSLICCYGKKLPLFLGVVVVVRL